MTAIQLLEKLGADMSFNLSMLSEEDKKSIEDIILKANTFNAMEIIHAPEEEEPEEETEDESEKEKNVLL
jgi:hypothetical protein